MKVGITMRVTQESSYYEERDTVSHDWLSFLQSMRCEIQLIPNIIPYTKNLKVDALILSNGNDIGLNKMRDNVELKLFEHALEKKIPVLGVCRGMQFMNSYFKGRLDRIGEIGFHVNQNHLVHIADKKFEHIMGSQLFVNSFHHYGVYSKNVSSTLKMFACHRRDDVCEGLYHPELPLLGIQWHPERVVPDDQKSRKLIDCFLKGDFFWMERS
ncbi:MAG: gamma-glutamyl-gamma-aminobutyrate hydrolase family protein [Deltaproteobacteria bacterium]|nr:gamma-glutamyl-gamma-aminobutyrate hydrolase family protein [Deltaproteobacteria bacterium]